MKRGSILMVIALFLPALVSQVSAGTTLVINHAEYDPANKDIVLYGANFDSFDALEVWIGDINLTSLSELNCKIESTQFKCGVAGTPAEAGGTWIVRVSACNAPHCQDEIHLAIISSGVSCNSGDYVECYTGDLVTKGVGECVPGIRSCTEEGVWTECEGEITPTPEMDLDVDLCYDGLDNNCNSLVDCDDPDCIDSSYCVCTDNDGDGVGIGPGCEGAQDCDDGDLSNFPGNPEVCDGQDNDCDGQPDFITMSCYTGIPDTTQGVGECQAGSSTCLEGEWGSCTGEVTPQTEVCDGQDNDCDGVIDGMAQSCYTGPAGTLDVGLCEAGSQFCLAGSWNSCEGEVTPYLEVCNGRDDDCSGIADDPFDFESDENNCGDCDVVCEPWKVCCNHECVDLEADNLNCGACGLACGEFENCVEGWCTD